MEAKEALAERFGHVEMFRTCEQCGCCSSACPITGLESFNIRRIVRHVELDLIDEIAATPQPWACTTCGRCEGVCPNGIAILDIIRPLRALAPEDLRPAGPAPCAAACPAAIDVPGYVRRIARGEPEQAYRLILEELPFPGVLGRVCTHPCETRCRRSEVNRPIAICALKRFAADAVGTLPAGSLPKKTDTGHRVAVVGAGPAGLTAAFYLRQKGHQVTLFESRPRPGGMLRFAIPAYRLPEPVLESEIDQVLNTGIELKTGLALGRDFDLQQLRAEGFEAVLLAIGLQQSRRIELEGSDLPGVEWGLEFLAAAREGHRPLSGRVLVVGGGNVAIDVALTALRLGAEEVRVACLESREEMPANSWEIDLALEEGVELLPCWGPRRIMAQNGRVSGAELVRCTSVFDAGGRFCPAFGEETRVVPAELVLLAVGQTSDLACIGGREACEIENQLIRVNPETLETSLPGVFAGGDAVTGPGTVIQAVAAGKAAARAIDRHLGGDGHIGQGLAGRAEQEPYTGKREKGFADRPRVEVPTRALNERRRSFEEVDLCYAAEQARQEAGRCLQCDLELRLAGELREPAG